MQGYEHLRESLAGELLAAGRFFRQHHGVWWYKDLHPVPRASGAAQTSPGC